MVQKRVGQRLGPKRFRAQVTDPTTGKRRSITASSEADLERRVRKLRDVKLGLQYGELTVTEAVRALRPAVGVGLRVRDIWQRYREGVRAPSQTAADQAWTKILEPLLGDLPAADLDEGPLRKWMVEMERPPEPGEEPRGRDGNGYAPRTLGLAFSFLQAAYTQAVAKGLLPCIPWGAYRPHLPKGARYPREAATTPEELFRLFDVVREADLKEWAMGHYAARYFACVVLGLTGIRQAEACGLSWSAVKIDSEPFMLKVRAQAPRGWRKRFRGDAPRLPPKNKKERVHVLHDGAVAILRFQRDQLRRRGWYRDDGPVFPSDDGGWRACGYVLRPEVFREFVVKAGLTNPAAWSPHSLRHSCATLEAAANGGDLKSVAARTGHADIKILEGYLHRSGRGLATSKIEQLPVRLLSPALPELVTLGEEVPALPPAGAPAEGHTLGEMEMFTRQALELPWVSERKKRDETEAEELSLNDAARAWVAAGCRPKPRPKAVTAAMQRAWQRGWQREMYAGNGKDAAKATAHLAKRAFLGAWGRAVKNAEREAGARSVVETTGAQA